MQRNITEKLKISKSQKNNSIKLLAATIALSAGLTAMDKVAANLDDELYAKKTVFKEPEEDVNEVEEDFTVIKRKEVETGGDASSLPPEDLRIGEEKKKEENGENDEVKVDDLVRTLTGEKEEVADNPGRGTNPLPYQRNSVVEKDEDIVAANACPSAPIKEEQKQLVKAPTVANVVVGWGVFLGQSAVGVISYLTPNFVKSAYGKGKAFFTSLGEIKRFFCPKK